MDGPPLIEYSENFRPPQPMLSLRDAVPILSDIAPQVTLNFDSHIDAIRWDLTESGTYSSRSLYRILRDGGKIGWAFSYVWKAKAPPTVRIFRSLAIQNKILTREVLQIRNIPCQLNCPMCNSGNPEIICHLLFTCAYAGEVWGFVQNTAMKLILTRQLDHCSSIEEVWEKSWLEARGQGGMAKAEWLNRFLCVCWWLWRQRNEVVFKGKHRSAVILVRRFCRRDACGLNSVN